MTTPEQIRPSSLPKLAECRCYVGKPGTSEAAERGTRLDGIIRDAWANGIRDYELEPLPKEDQEAVRWALEALRRLSKGFTVITDEEHLRAEVPVEGVIPGTMDALCVNLAWLADFKTGQVRDYTGQMAAYALACMDAYFAEEWTAYLLFVDEKLVITHNFSRDEAEQTVRVIVDAPKVERRCDYCKWCGRAAECGVVNEAISSAVAAPALPACTAAAKSKAELPEPIAALVEDHAAAHEFLSKFAIVSEWVDVLKNKLKEQVTGDDPYFQRVVMSGRKVVMPLQLSKYGMEFGFDRMLKMCSAIPEKKVREAWAEVFGDKPMPDELVTSQGGSVHLRLKKINK